MDVKHLARMMQAHATCYCDQAADMLLAQAAELAALRAARAAERDAMTTAMSRCRGIPDSRCNYLSHCYGLCNKCGKQHDGVSAGGGNG